MSTVQPKAKKEKKGIITPVFRLSFPHLFVPQEAMQAGAKAKYGCMAIFSPDSMDVKDKTLWSSMIALANEAAVKKFGKPLKDLPPNYKRPFHRGDEKKEYGLTKEQRYTNITSHVKPEIRMPDGVTKLEDWCRKNGKTPDEIIFPGIYCRASVNAFDYKKGGGMGVAFGLNGLMYVKTGERLDNRTLSEEEFEDYIDPNFTGTLASTDDGANFDDGLDAGTSDDDLGF